MRTRLFTREELEALDLPWSALDKVDVEEARWGTRRNAIFEFEGSFWWVPYYDPATEMQEGQDVWEDADVVQATEIHKVAVTVEQWEPKP